MVPRKNSKKKSKKMRDEDFSFWDYLLGKVDNQYVNNTINKNFLVTYAVTILALILLFVYHLSVNQFWSYRFDNLNQELEKTKGDLQHYKSSYENLLKDLEVYDDVYEKQITSLEYARDINFFEAYYANGYVQTWCLPEKRILTSGMPKITITASSSYANGWPVMHVFIDGRNVRSFEVGSTQDVEYSVTPTLLDTNHTMDIIFNNHYYNPDNGNERSITVKSIEIDGKEIEPGSGFYDAGAERNSLDCLSERAGWHLNENGALRFMLQR